MLDTERARKDASDWYDSPADPWWQHIQSSLQPPPESDNVVAPDLSTKPHVCPTCGVFYATRAAMLAHITKSHTDPSDVKDPLTFDKAKDAIGGVPQCAACGKQFPTWQLLQRHVVGRYCAAKHDIQPQLPAAPVEPAEARPELFCESTMQGLLEKHGANAIYHVPSRAAYAQHCMQCGQWIASSKTIKLPYKHSHPAFIQTHAGATLQMCKSYSSCGSPCPYWPINPSARSCGSFALVSLPSMETAQSQIDEVFGTLALESAANFGSLLTAENSERDRRAKQHKGSDGKGNGQGKRPRPSFNGSFGQRGGNPRGQRNSPAQDQAAHVPLIKAMGRLPVNSTGDSAPDSQTELCLDGVPQAGTARTHAASLQNCRGLPRSLSDEAYGCAPPGGPSQHTVSGIADLPSEPLLSAAAAECCKGESLDDPRRNWNYQRWNSETQCLQMDEARPPLEHQELIGHVGLPVKAVQQKDVIHRFNATHGIFATAEGTTSFMLEIGLRAPGVEKVWSCLEILSHLSALQLCGMQLKREGLKRSSLANDLQKMLQSYGGSCYVTHPSTAMPTPLPSRSCGVTLCFRFLSFRSLDQKSRPGVTSYTALHLSPCLGCRPGRLCSGVGTGLLPSTMWRPLWHTSSLSCARLSCKVSGSLVLHYRRPHESSMPVVWKRLSSYICKPIMARCRSVLMAGTNRCPCMRSLRHHLLYSCSSPGILLRRGRL